MGVPEELPDEATELARIASDPGQPRPRRDQAWRRLLPVVERLAHNAAPICREAAENAPGEIWRRLEPDSDWLGARYDPARGDFEKWCRVVLYHYAVDQARARRREPGLTAAGAGGEGRGTEVRDAVDRAAEREEGTDPLTGRKQQLRAALDRLGQALRKSAQGTDYFAVLLLQLRLVMAHQVSDGLQADGSIPATEAADFVAWCLPWSAEEEARVFRPDWPRLAAVWDCLRPCLNRPPHWLAAPEFCDRLTALLGGAAVLTPDAWNHWVNRAKEKARDRFGERTWEEFFARYLPDRRSGPGGGGGAS